MGGNQLGRLTTMVVKKIEKHIVNVIKVCLFPCSEICPVAVKNTPLQIAAEFVTKERNTFIATFALCTISTTTS